MRMIRKLLHYSGLGEERLHFELLSSSEASRFKDIVVAVTDSVKNAGPLDRSSCHKEIEAALLTADSKDIRWITGKQKGIVAHGDVYGRHWSNERYQAVLDDAVERDYHCNLICIAIREGFTSVREISSETGIELLRISYLLAELERTGRVSFTGMTDKQPVFAVI